VRNARPRRAKPGAETPGEADCRSGFSAHQVLAEFGLLIFHIDIKKVIARATGTYFINLFQPSADTFERPMICYIIHDKNTL